MRAWFRAVRLRRLAALVPVIALISGGVSIALASSASAATPPTYTFGPFGTVTVTGTVTDPNVQFSTYTVDASATCTSTVFNGTNCVPQTIVGTVAIPAATYPAPGTAFSATPALSTTCGYVQEDVYSGTVLTTINGNGGNANGDTQITGKLVNLGTCPPPNTGGGGGGTTPPLVGAPAPVIPTATGTLAESCPTETSNGEAFTVTVTNTGTANETFTSSISGVVVDTGASFAPGSTYTFSGTLPSKTASTAVTAQIVNGSTPINVPLTLAGTELFPCVLGETITKPTLPNPPTVGTPPTAVEPVTVTKPPTATLPFTGLPTTDVALVGIGFVGAGGALLFGTRRRAAKHVR